MAIPIYNQSAAAQVTTWDLQMASEMGDSLMGLSP